MDDMMTFFQQQKVRDAVCESALHLNAGDYGRFLQMCDQKHFEYSIINFSPEIKKVQCWMKQNYSGLAKVLDLLPKHNSDHARLTRHVIPYRVTAKGNGAFEVVSQTAVYRTEWDAENSHLQSGATRLYVIGKYVDCVTLTDSGAQLTSRVVDLDTRQVGIGSHHIL